VSDFKVKIHQIRFQLGLHSRVFSAPPDPPAVLKGPTSKDEGGERDGRERIGEGKVKGRGIEEGGFGPPKIFDVAPAPIVRVDYRKQN